MKCIQYAAGYKYQLRRMYSELTPIIPPRPIKTNWINLDADGLLTIMIYYAWDGPSGLTIDTPDTMRPALVHDAFYQLMREGYLDRVEYREPVDLYFRESLLEDGMLPLRAEVWYAAIRAFANPATDPAVIEPDQLAGCGCPPGWNRQCVQPLIA